MKPSKLLLVLVFVLGFASQAFADPVPCPDTGNPGYIGDDGLTFLDIDPAAPDATQVMTFTVGQTAFDPTTLSAQIDGSTVNVLLSGTPNPITAAPQATCLSTAIGPFASGSYTVRVIVLPSDATPPYVAATSPLDVAEAPGEGTLPITGAMTSNWYDPAHSGEGIIVQIALYPPDDQDDVSTALVFDWFTFDANGNPFWIAGNATIDPDNPTSITVPAAYSTDGGFAGDFGAATTVNPWGTLTFQFPDLDHVTIDYAANDGLPADIPQGSGTLHYLRLLRVDGLCTPPMLCLQ
ncbi:MAG TPA: hypothetical protein VFG55_00400 [Rhodanobacteraceae bacterium]|nr:hypothetical protein [Rhodanobacteraceae bacterium]